MEECCVEKGALAVLTSRDLLVELMRAVASVGGPRALALCTAVNSAWRAAATNEAVWEPLAAARWAGYELGATWLRIATAAARDQLDALEPGLLAQHGWATRVIEVCACPSRRWPLLYSSRQAELTITRPIFAMPSALSPGVPIGLHLFEPRYRRLIAVALHNAMENSVSAHPTFIFSTRVPAAGVLAYLCEAHLVQLHWDENIDSRFAPLAWGEATVQSFPTPGADALFRLFHMVRGRGLGSISVESEDEDSYHD
jgi:hypothetical protein